MVFLAYAVMDCGFGVYGLESDTLHYFQRRCNHFHHRPDEYFSGTHNNLIYSVLLHFGFNILYVFLDADIGFFVILTALYLVIMPVAVLIRNKTVENFLKNNDNGEKEKRMSNLDKI